MVASTTTRSRGRAGASVAWSRCRPTIAKPRPPRRISDPDRREDERIATKPARLRKPPNRSIPPLLNAEIEWNTPTRPPAGPAPSREEGGGQSARPDHLRDDREDRDPPDDVVTLPSSDTPVDA